jgi:outer membrane protein
MYNDFRAESVLLSDDLKRKREDVIVTREKEYRTSSAKILWPRRRTFQKRQSLVKPIQDDIYNTIKTLAAEGNYAVIFDKSGGLTMLYTDPKYDLSDQILEKMGYKN